ncbi:MAG: hypothetical protein ACYC5Y_16035 [Symbiobacteriia bacterium]
MANTNQGGNQKNRAFAPAGAGFNLDQFQNEVASEIGLSLGRQGTFGQGAQSAYTPGQGAGSMSTAGNAGMAGAGSASGATSALGSSTFAGLTGGAAGTSGQADFEASATLGQQQKPPASKVAKQHDQQGQFSK